MNLEELKKLSKAARNDAWPVSFSQKSFYRDRNNNEFSLTSMSGMPLSNSQLIAAATPDLILKLIAVAEAAAHAVEYYSFSEICARNCDPEVDTHSPECCIEQRFIKVLKDLEQGE